MHVRTLYVCPVTFDVSRTSRIAYVIITIFSVDSANPCLFQQCVSDVNDLSYVIGSMPQDGSALNLRYHGFDTIKL